MKKSKEKKETVAVCLPPEVIRELRSKAAELGISVSALLSLVIAGEISLHD